MSGDNSEVCQPWDAGSSFKREKMEELHPGCPGWNRNAYLQWLCLDNQSFSSNADKILSFLLKARLACDPLLKEQSLRDRSGQLYINIHSQCDSKSKTWATSSQTKSQHGEDMASPPQAEELWASVSCWQKEFTFFKNVGPVSQPHPYGRPHF